MNIKKCNSLLAGLICLGLAACGTTDRTGGMTASDAQSGELYGETAGGTGTVTAPAIAASNAARRSDMSASSATSGASDTSASSGASGSSDMSAPSSGHGASGSSGASASPGAWGGAGASGAAATQSGSGSGGSAMSGDTQSATMTSYGVIQSIDAVSRSQAFGAGGMGGASGSVSSQSGGSGAMTGGGSADMVYRVTLRMDDGSTRAVIQESRPNFQTGDRVRMASNPVQRY